MAIAIGFKNGNYFNGGSHDFLEGSKVAAKSARVHLDPSGAEESHGLTWRLNRFQFTLGIGKPGKFVEEIKVDVADRAVSLFKNKDFGFAF